MDNKIPIVLLEIMGEYVHLVSVVLSVTPCVTRSSVTSSIPFQGGDVIPLAWAPRGHVFLSTNQSVRIKARQSAVGERTMSI